MPPKFIPERPPPEPFKASTDSKTYSWSRGSLYKWLFSHVSKKTIITVLFVCILSSYFLVLEGLNAVFDIAYPQLAGQASLRFGADSLDYADLADGVARGQFRDRWEGAPELFRAPGYPVFLFAAKKLTGDSGNYNRVGYLNIFMGAVSAVLFFMIVSRFLSNRLSVFLSLAFAFEPMNLWMVMGVDSDGLFLFILLLTMLCLVKFTLENRYLYGLLAIFLMSIDALVRPVGMFMALLVLLYTLVLLVWSRRTPKEALIGLVAIILFCLPILPWMARNYVETGYFTLSTLPSYAMFFNNIPYYEAYQLGLNRDEYIPQHTKQMLLKIGAPDGENARTLKYLPQVEEYVGDFLKENSWSYLAFHIASAKGFMFARNELISTWQITPVIRLYSAFEPYIWAVIYLLALAGVIFSKSNRFFALFLAAFVVLVVLLAGPMETARYRLALEPAAFLLAGLGLERLLRMLSAAISSMSRSIRTVSSLWTPS